MDRGRFPKCRHGTKVDGKTPYARVVPSAMKRGGKAVIQALGLCFDNHERARHSRRMDVRDAGRRGGQRKSPAKRVAAQKNGVRGGRPNKAQALLRRMRAMYEEVKDKTLDIDHGDLWLIIERLCREPNSGRRFFIRPLKDGGYGF